MLKPFEHIRRIIVTCNKRLAPYLEQEIRDLGFDPVRVFPTGVELKGTVTDCIRLNLNLRCASQVRYSIKELSVNSPEELYDKVQRIRWDEVMLSDGYFSVTSNVVHPSIKSELFANVKVKDAIVDYFRDKVGHRPDSGPELDHTVIHLFWRDREAEIFIDTSGETLAKHGYRKIPGKAPMLEALAAATVMATRWDKVSPFVNPMCGSGTVAIEAALLATNRRPGLFRENYAFMSLVGYDERVYKNELKKIREQVREVPNLLIIATDIREDAIDVTRVNAGIAGVDRLIEYGVGDFEKTSIPDGQKGVVFFNPEYGERLGEEKELEETYSRIGDFMKKQCRGYTGYIFTGNLELAKKIGLKASRRIEFHNAKLDCRLLEFELYEGSKRKE